jgi:hypothetical protein
VASVDEVDESEHDCFSVLLVLYGITLKSLVPDNSDDSDDVEIDGYGGDDDEAGSDDNGYNDYDDGDKFSCGLGLKQNRNVMAIKRHPNAIDV